MEYTFQFVDEDDLQRLISENSDKRLKQLNYWDSGNFAIFESIETKPNLEQRVSAVEEAVNVILGL